MLFNVIFWIWWFLLVMWGLHIFWPWDWKGKKKKIVLKRKKNPWEK